jgi:nicotinate-nucleotide adenylyltransferase
LATGLVGGTFDPIHIAHLIIAEEALDRLGLDRVLFIPASRPPHKPDCALSPVETRLRMIELAVADNPRLAVSDIEARRPEPSYTIETIRELRKRLGASERLCFIMGADSLVQFFTWREPEALIRECEFAVVPRPGVDMSAADPRIRERAVVLEAPLMAVSSTDIRDRVRRGVSIRYLVPESVRTFIGEKKLYS